MILLALSKPFSSYPTPHPAKPARNSIKLHFTKPRGICQEPWPEQSLLCSRRRHCPPGLLPHLARTILALTLPQVLPSPVAASPGQHKACLDLATVTAFPGCCLLRPKNMLVFTPGTSKADPSLVFLRKIRQLQLTSISSALQSRSFTAVTTAGSAT